MLETIKYLIIKYGYIAIFLGAFFESESIVLILGGLAARLGYLDLPWLMAVSYCAIFGGDQFYFFLGRWRGKEILSRYPRWEKAVGELQKILGSERALKFLALRFLIENLESKSSAYLRSIRRLTNVSTKAPPDQKNPNTKPIMIRAICAPPEFLWKFPPY